ncbi:hypothetical protein SAMN02745823_03110 [Sporobacter termitidis DSM 10068]|uniref:Flavodoxin n=1 Tax=Sporobacter termitidis DSM 10068 TaxID=1123282 RepID=A0A1M5Z2P9_9FIRM|nr:flavodoxin family protein [Sporobacter termitidis]SHI18173.1 hypothetical protein SAMN02745823_03110 [Sporobacter termitidis DSM 10068]
MKIAVISYSLTGNNEVLAKGVAGALPAEHIRLTEDKRRTNATIFGDVVLGRTPKVRPGPESMAPYDLVIFVGPVWMGTAAFPFRAYFRRLKKEAKRYAYISLSGGSLGSNTKLSANLKKQTGRAPEAVVDLHIADLLPQDPKPTTKDIGAYRVSEETARRLTGTVVGKLREKVLKEA